jgi:psiF repeat
MRKMLITTMMSAFCASAAFAQTTPTTPPGTNPPAATKPTPKVKAPETPRSAESIECSKQADAKGLHGKPRQTFRANCIKGMKKKT